MEDKIYPVGSLIHWTFDDDEPESIEINSIVLGFGIDKDIVSKPIEQRYYLVEVPPVVKKRHPEYGFPSRELEDHEREDMTFEQLDKAACLGKRLYYVNERYIKQGELEIQIDLIKEEIYGKTHTKKKA